MSGLPNLESRLSRGNMPGPPGTSGRTEVPASGETLSCAALGRIRGDLLRCLQEGAIQAFRDGLPHYAGTLEGLVRAAAKRPEEQLRLESDHRLFFEQVKAVLVTNRIQLRLELERVKASRRYGREDARPSRAVWEG